MVVDAHSFRISPRSKTTELYIQTGLFRLVTTYEASIGDEDAKIKRWRLKTRSCLGHFVGLRRILGLN